MAKRDQTSQASVSSRRRLRVWRRTWAVALVTFRQGMRMRLWILVPLAVSVLILTDLSSPRFDPVFEGIPAAVGTSLLVMAVVAVVLGVFFATYSIPAEMETKVSYSVATKPVGRWEVVAGKTVGMSILVLAMLALIGAGAYGYVLARAGGIRSLAARRLEEARPRAAHPADVNALEAAARNGPLTTYRYRTVDAGPDVQIHFPPDMPPEPGVRWILGETSMPLRWNLSETPLREWVASGTVRLRIALRVCPPSQGNKTPVKVNVWLVSESPDVAAGPPTPDEAPHLVRQVVAEVPPSGVLEVPVAGPLAQPVEGVLNVPPSGKIHLDITAETAGRLLGAAAGAVRIIGPAGREFHLQAAPQDRPSADRDGAYLVGRTELPRQMAVLRFDNVPGDVLGSADTAVEIRLRLEAWSPATVQPAAKATFLNPATRRRKALTFTPEGHHATLLYLDRAFWHGGPLEVHLECLTADDSIGLVPGSVRLRLDGGPFAVHFAKAILCVWFFGTVLAAVGVLPSTRFTWYTSILGTAVLLLASFMRDFLRGFLLRETWVRDVAWRVARWAEAHWEWDGWDDLAEHVVVPLPDVWALLPDDTVSMGQVIPLTQMAVSFGWAALGTVVLVSVGAYLLRKREVAA